MEDAFFSMFNWKLESAADYLQIVIILGGSAIVLYLYTLYARRLRKQEVAVPRINKRIKKFLTPEAVLLESPTFQFKEETFAFDGLAVDAQGILLIKTYGRGVEIYGRPDGESWTLVDRALKVKVENPLLAMNKATKELKTSLAKAGMPKMDVRPLIVFADTFERPSIQLGVIDGVMATKGLKKFFKTRNKTKGTVSPEKVVSALESYVKT